MDILQTATNGHDADLLMGPVENKGTDAAQWNVIGCDGSSQTNDSRREGRRSHVAQCKFCSEQTKESECCWSLFRQYDQTCDARYIVIFDLPYPGLTVTIYFK